MKARERIEEISMLGYQSFAAGRALAARFSVPYIPEGMTANELEEYAHDAYRQFYLRPRILMKKNLITTKQCVETYTNKSIKVSLKMKMFLKYHSTMRLKTMIDFTTSLCMI